MCTILKKVVGPGAKFRIAGTVTPDAYKVSAGFYNIKLYKEYYMKKIELTCEVSNQSFV